VEPVSPDHTDTDEEMETGVDDGEPPLSPVSGGDSSGSHGDSGGDDGGGSGVVKESSAPASPALDSPVPPEMPIPPSPPTAFVSVSDPEDAIPPSPLRRALSSPPPVTIVSAATPPPLSPVPYPTCGWVAPSLDLSVIPPTNNELTDNAMSGLAAPGNAKGCIDLQEVAKVDVAGSGGWVRTDLGYFDD
jgi:hypothetical protein